MKEEKRKVVRGGGKWNNEKERGERGMRRGEN